MTFPGYGEDREVEVEGTQLHHSGRGHVIANREGINELARWRCPFIGWKHDGTIRGTYGLYGIHGIGLGEGGGPTGKVEDGRGGVGEEERPGWEFRAVQYSGLIS